MDSALLSEIPTSDTSQVLREDEVVVGCVRIKGHVHLELANPWVHLQDSSQMGLRALIFDTSQLSWLLILMSSFRETLEQASHRTLSPLCLLISEPRHWRQRMWPHTEVHGVFKVSQADPAASLKCSAKAPLMHQVASGLWLLPLATQFSKI